MEKGSRVRDETTISSFTNQNDRDDTLHVLQSIFHDGGMYYMQEVSSQSSLCSALLLSTSSMGTAFRIFVLSSSCFLTSSAL